MPKKWDVTGALKINIVKNRKKIIENMPGRRPASREGKKHINKHF